MNLTQRLLAISALFFATATLAVADPVSTSINVSGHDTFSNSSLTFISPFASLGDSGAFANFTGGTVDYFLGTVDPLDSVVSLGVFSITDSTGNVLTFYTTDNAATLFNDPTTGYLDLTNDETGYYTLNGGPQMAGFFDVTFYGTSANGAVDESFSGSGGLDPGAIAPEPASWLLLGTALVALASTALFSRRRHTFHTAA